MIDTRYIGRQLPTLTFEVEKGRLRFFAQAIGETRPEYIDEAAAQAVGYRSLPAPPTFLFAAELDAGSLNSLLDELEVPIERILHGEQSFRYYVPVCAGDFLTAESHIADIYAKKGGAFEFIVKDTVLTNQQGAKVLDARSVIVVRNPQGPSA